MAGPSIVEEAILAIRTEGLEALQRMEQALQNLEAAVLGVATAAPKMTAAGDKVKAAAKIGETAATGATKAMKAQADQTKLLTELELALAQVQDKRHARETSANKKIRLAQIEADASIPEPIRKQKISADKATKLADTAARVTISGDTTSRAAINADARKVDAAEKTKQEAYKATAAAARASRDVQVQASKTTADLAATKGKVDLADIVTKGRKYVADSRIVAEQVKASYRVVEARTASLGEPSKIANRLQLAATAQERLQLGKDRKDIAARNSVIAGNRLIEQAERAHLASQTALQLSSSRTRQIILRGMFAQLNRITQFGTQTLSRTFSFGLNTLGRIQSSLFGALGSGWRRLLQGREKDLSDSLGRQKGLFSRFGGDPDVQGQGILSKLTGGRIAGIIAAAGGALGARSVLSAGLDRFQTIEDSTKSLTLFLQSGDKAKQMMTDILAIVKGTPFSLSQFAEAGKNLVAFGVEASKVPKVLTAIGEAAAASGGSAQTVDSISQAFGQAASIGKINGDILLRLGESGVPALKILANAAGVTTEAMQKMVSEGAVPAAEGIDVLTKGILEGTTGINGATQKLGGTMQTLGNTLSGARANFKAATARLGASIITPLAPTIIAGLNKGVKILDAVGKAYTKTAGSIIAAIKYMKDRVHFDLVALFNNPLLKAALAPLIFTLAALRAGLRATFNERTLKGVYSAGNGINRFFMFLYDNVGRVIPQITKFTDYLLRLTQNVNARGLTALLDPFKSIGARLKDMATGAKSAIAPVLGLTAGLTATGAVLSQLKRGNAGGALLAGLTFGFIGLYKNNETFRNGITTTIGKVKELGHNIADAFGGKSVAGGFAASLATVLGTTGKDLFNAGSALVHTVTALFRGDSAEAKEAADNFKDFLFSAFGRVGSFVSETFSNLFKNVDVVGMISTAHDLLVTVGTAIGRFLGSKEFGIAVAGAIGSLLFVVEGIVEGIVRGIVESDLGTAVAKAIGVKFDGAKGDFAGFFSGFFDIDFTDGTQKLIKNLDAAATDISNAQAIAFSGGGGAAAPTGGSGSSQVLTVIGKIIETIVVAGPRIAAALGKVLINAVKFAFSDLTHAVGTFGALLAGAILLPFLRIKKLPANLLSSRTGLGGVRDNLRTVGAQMSITANETAAKVSNAFKRVGDAARFAGGKITPTAPQITPTPTRLALGPAPVDLSGLTRLNGAIPLGSNTALARLDDDLRAQVATIDTTVRQVDSVGDRARKAVTGFGKKLVDAGRGLRTVAPLSGLTESVIGTDIGKQWARTAQQTEGQLKTFAGRIITAQSATTKDIGRAFDTTSRSLGNLKIGIGATGIDGASRTFTERIVAFGNSAQRAASLIPDQVGRGLSGLGNAIISAAQHSEGGFERLKTGVAASWVDVKRIFRNGATGLGEGLTSFGGVLDRTGQRVGDFVGKVKANYGKIVSVSAQTFPVVLAGVAAMADGFNRLGDKSWVSKLIGAFEILGSITAIVNTVNGAMTGFGSIMDIVRAKNAATAASNLAVGASATVMAAETEVAATEMVVAATTAEASFGPIGWVIAGITLLIAAFASQMGDSAEKVDQVTKAVDDAKQSADGFARVFRDAVDASGGDRVREISTVYGGLIKQLREGDGATEALDSGLRGLGFGLEDFAKGVVVGGDALKALTGRADAAVAASKSAADGFRGLFSGSNRIEAGLLTTGDSDVIDGVRAKVDALKAAVNDPALQTPELQTAFEHISKALDDADPKAYEKAVNEAADALDRAGGAAAGVGTQLRLQSDAMRVQADLARQLADIAQQNRAREEEKTSAAERTASVYDRQKARLQEINGLLESATTTPQKTSQAAVDAGVLAAKSAGQQLKGDEFKGVDLIKSLDLGTTGPNAAAVRQITGGLASTFNTALSIAAQQAGDDPTAFNLLADTAKQQFIDGFVAGGVDPETAKKMVDSVFDPLRLVAQEQAPKLGLEDAILSTFTGPNAVKVGLEATFKGVDTQGQKALTAFLTDPSNTTLKAVLDIPGANEAIKKFAQSKKTDADKILFATELIRLSGGDDRYITQLTDPKTIPVALAIQPGSIADTALKITDLQRDRALVLAVGGDTKVIDDQIKWLQATKLNLETSLVHKPGTKFLWWDWKKIDGSTPGGEATTETATVPLSADTRSFNDQINKELAKPRVLNVQANLKVTLGDIDSSVRSQIKATFPNFSWFNGPKAAEGRVITRDQIIRVGEENKPEVILPLTKPARMKQLIRETGVDQFVMKHMTSTRSSSVIDEYQKRIGFRGFRDGGMIGAPVVGQFKGWEFLTKPTLQFIAHVGVAAPDGPSPTTTGLPGTGISFLKGDTGTDGAPGVGISWLKSKVVGALASWITEAISITGVPASWFTGLVTIAKRESGGNPKAINLWDSNAKAGHPSKGLMQTIDGTFNRYSLPGHKDIYNPVDNAIAAIRYILARYKDIKNVQQADPTKRPKGYDNGGLILKDQLIRVGERDKPELILPLTKPKRMIQLIREHGIDRFVERHHIRGYADGGFIPGKLKRKYEVPKIPAPKKRIPGKLRPPSGGPDVSEFDVSHWDPADPTDLADRNRVGEFADRGMGRRIRIARERTERHIIDLISNATLGHLRFRGPFPAAANVARTTPLDAIQSVKDQTSVGKSPLAALRRAGTYEVAAVMTQMFGAALGNGTKDSRDVAGSIGVASRVMADRISGIGGRALGELLRLQARLLASVATVRVGGDGRLGRVVPWEQLDPLLARQVPKFAQGGVILRDQLIRVGEENKPELILPLTKPQRMIQLIREHSIDKFVERHNIRGFATGGLVGGPAPTGRLPKVRKRKYDPNEQYVPGRREVLTDQWKADTATTKIMLGDIANTVAPLITAPTATPITRALRDILVNSVSERGLIKRGLDWHHFLFGYEGPSASLRRIVARTAADVASGFGSAVKDAKGDLRQRLMGIGAVVDTARKGFGEAWAEYGYPITNTLTRVAATAEPSEGPAWSPGKRTIESGALVGEINKRWAFFQPQIAGQNPGYRVRDDIPSVRDLAKFFGGIGGGGVVKGHEFGGVVTRDQIIRIAERNQPELVLPLTKPDRMWSLIQQTGIDKFVTDRIGGLDGSDKIDLSAAVDTAKKSSLASSGSDAGAGGTVQHITYAPVTNLHTNVVDPASAAAYFKAENERMFKKLVAL